MKHWGANFGKSPSVSVVMSVHNDKRYVKASIESVLKQTFSDFEFIIVDNASTDGSEAILKDYALVDSRIRLLQFEVPGLTNALNFALSYATGEYIARQDADDILSPQRLEKQVRFLEANRDVALVGTGIRLIDVNGDELGVKVYPTSHDALCELLLKCENPLPHSTIMCRKLVFDQLGHYDSLFAKAQDYALYLRVIQGHRVASLDEPLTYLRYRTDSIAFGDDSADQLRFALLARLLFAKGLLSANVQGGIDNWDEFYQFFNDWFISEGFVRRHQAKKQHRQMLALFVSRQFIRCLGFAWKSLLLDPGFYFRKMLKRNDIWNGKYSRIPFPINNS
jgi:glycosyltransferase involved in cell wall biosynthesis